MRPPKPRDGEPWSFKLNRYSSALLVVRLKCLLLEAARIVTPGTVPCFHESETHGDAGLETDSSYSETDRAVTHLNTNFISDKWCPRQLILARRSDMDISSLIVLLDNLSQGIVEAGCAGHLLVVSIQIAKVATNWRHETWVQYTEHGGP
jgi:hypothetical protein